MTRIALAVLFASTTLAAMPALAARIDIDSKVDAVTVFPSGAQVARVAVGALEAGEHTIVIDDLPAFVDPASIRVEGTGTGITIGSVDVRNVAAAASADPAERRRIEQQIAALQDEAVRLDRQLADIDVRRSVLTTLANGAAGPRGDGAAPLGAADIDAILDTAATRLGALNDETVTIRAARRTVDEDLASLYEDLNRQAPEAASRTAVEVQLTADAATQGSFIVRYNVAEAGWRAVYDAAIDLGDGVEDLTLALTRRALVTQSTSESWDNVALVLSTARPGGATDAPDLPGEILDRIEVQPYGNVAARGKMEAQSVAPAAAPYAADAAEMRLEEPIREAEAAMDTGGFQATYTIAGRVSVTNAGEDKSVLIGNVEHKAALTAVSVPRFDPAAYLVAEFTHDGADVYLPGEVLLTRNGAYVGRGAMPLLAAGEEHSLGFGPDDFVVVERIDVDRTKRETGILTTSNVDQRTWTFTATNRHDFAMPVRIIDRVPASNQEDIRVETLPPTTAFDVTDLDGKRGVGAWDRTIAAGAKEEMTLSYRVSWPKDMAITLSE